MKVRRALISVHDKTGIVDFAGALAGLGVEILSTGGTAKLIRESGVPVIDVSEADKRHNRLPQEVGVSHPAEFNPDPEEDGPASCSRPGASGYIE